jgi:hypothetical protein
MTDSYPANNDTDWVTRWVTANGADVNPTDVDGWVLCAPRLVNPLF